MRLFRQISVISIFLIQMFFLNCYGQTTIKILAIGNSFSEDVVEECLDDLARVANIKVISVSPDLETVKFSFFRFPRYRP